MQDYETSRNKTARMIEEAEVPTARIFAVRCAKAMQSAAERAISLQHFEEAAELHDCCVQLLKPWCSISALMPAEGEHKSG